MATTWLRLVPPPSENLSIRLGVAEREGCSRTRAMTLVPHGRRDAGHGMPGRIVASEEWNALTSSRESCIVEISGALQGPLRGQPNRASRAVPGSSAAAVSRPAAAPRPADRRLPCGGVVGGVAL